MTSSILEMKELIVQFGAELYQRNLTDAAGGNISARVDDLILITPTQAGHRFHWNLKPNQILVLDTDGNIVEGKGKMSKEAKVHVSLLTEFYPTAKALVHAHSKHILVFCASGVPIRPVLDATMKFGEIGFCQAAPVGSEDLACNITEAFKGQEEKIKKQAALIMAPRHGVFALGKDLYSAFDAVERVDINAYCLLNSNLEISFPDAPENLPASDE